MVRVVLVLYIKQHFKHAFSCFCFFFCVVRNLVVNLVHKVVVFSVEFSHLCSLFCISLNNSSYFALKTVVVGHFK